VGATGAASPGGTSRQAPPDDDTLQADPAEIRRVMEYYHDRGWTDGLPVVPVTESYLAEFLATTSRDPDEVLMPMPQLHVQFGLGPSDSTVTAMIIRSCLHIEARHTTVPEQLALDIAGTISRTGALIHETISALVVLSPEHARLFARVGWTKADLSQFIYDHAVRSRAELAAVGKNAIARQTRWRLPADHPDAAPDPAQADGTSDVVRVLNSPGAVLVIVAGANNAGVSAVIESFGPRGGPPAIVPVASGPAG
jgi:hypothetical protein